ncbi:SAV_2336 N-terminal domain-related protein, partial [Paractinoplanes deccanensis]
VELFAPRPPRPARPVGQVRRARTVEVPKPIALAERLAFQRALRPLLRRVPAPGLGTLDEEETARRAADMPAGHPWPAVLRPAGRLWLDAAVVVDRGDSMAIWQDLAADIVGVLRESGAFRQVARYRLDGTDESGAAVVTDWTGRPLPPGRLVDPGNRRVIFVISDCVGPVWRSGGAARVLHEWGHHGPVAILQPLPERLWARTAARTIAGALVAPRACAPNSTLRFTAFGGRDRPEGTLVPVLEVDPGWLRRWTGLVAGGPAITAAVTVVSGEPAEPLPAAPVPALSAEQRVRLFRAAASDEAFRLARYVAVGDPQIDVIRHVHYAMFKPAYPAHLAEVLLSGLLRVEDGKRGWYSFVDRVPDVLLSTLSISETVHAAELLEEVSASVNRQMAGTRTRFPVRTPGEGGGAIGEREAPFAVTPLARRRLELARARLQRYAEPPPPPETGPPADDTPEPPPARRAGVADRTRPLDPETAAVRFTHRDAELGTLLDWAEGTGPGTALVTGAAGTGKTRLALELARTLRERGRPVTVNGVPPAPGGDRPLIVVDDWDGDLAAAEEAGGGSRVLLLCRSAPRDGLTPLVHLEAWADPAVRLAFHQRAVEDFSHLMWPGSRPPSAPGPGEHDDTPLALSIAALHHIGGLPAATLEALPGRERRLAERSAVRAEISFTEPGRLDAYLAAAQLYGASSADEARGLTRLVGRAGSPEEARRTADWLHRLYPGGVDGYWRLLPGPVRRWLVTPALARDATLIGLLPAVSDSQAGNAMPLLVRAALARPSLAAPLWAAAVERPERCASLLAEARRGGGLTDPLLDQVRATLADEQTSVAVLRAVIDGVPEAGVIFRGQPAERARTLAGAYQRLANASAPHRPALADAAHEMGLIAERDGQDDEALRTVEWEIDLRRRLTGDAAALARALTTYALRLDRAGRPVQGNAAITEAAGIYRRLGDAYAEQDAYAQAQHARILAQLGRLAEAADAAREATTRCRRLAATDPRHTAGLADALLVEAAVARARRQRDQAVLAGGEAVDLYERLAAEDPDRHRARYAFASAAHGMDLAEYRSHASALSRLDRAAEIYRDLDPAGLATAQLGRGAVLADLERHDEAIAAFAEVVTLGRRLGGRDRSLAGALAAQAEVTAAAGRPEEALALLTEACVLRDQLHAADPVDTALRRDLISGYRSLAALQERLGHTEDAARSALRARLMSES